MAKERDPTASEFFNDESLAGFSDALVRECIQNSLDAANGTIDVRFSIRSGSDRITSKLMSRYARGLWPHVGKTLPTKSGFENEPCRVLVIEDFGTTGLTGDPTASDPPAGIQNNFYYFVRVEGKSGKSGKDRGRWGLGKNVFTQASEIRTMFAYSVADPPTPNWSRPLLIGQSTLLNHEFDGTQYQPDGWWSDSDPDGLPIPITDTSEVANFTECFDVQRQDDEPGLTLVIPYLVEDVIAEAIAASVVREYYIAILGGRLKVTVEETGKDSFEIDEKSIRSVASQLNLGSEVERAMDLAQWGLGLEDADFEVLARTGETNWDSLIGRLDADDLERLQGRFTAEKRLALRVPISVQVQNAIHSADSYFDVLVEEDSNFRGPAVFVREGIRVPRVDNTNRAGARMIVLVRQLEAARMVGDSEGPAHTDWSPRGEKFRGRYREGMNWLSFIKRSPIGVLKLLRGENDKPDKTIAIDYFFLPDAGDGKAAASSGPRGKRKRAKPAIPPITRIPRLKVDRTADGFRVRIVAEKPETVKQVDVVAAYDVRRGSPVSRWSPADFDLANMPRTVDGGTVIGATGNRLSVTVDDSTEFKLQVNGFDTNRDLYVTAREPRT